MARIAIALAEDFEDSEFTVPVDRLKNADHEMEVFGAKAGEIVTGKQRQARATIEHTAARIDVDEFDALLIPGGYSPDHLRTDEDVVRVVREFVESGKPVAAICHGPQLLIEADVVRGRKVTSYPSVRTDLVNAGAHWVDKAVVVDGNLITSRRPADLDAFGDALLRQLDSAESPAAAAR